MELKYFAVYGLNRFLISRFAQNVAVANVVHEFFSSGVAIPSCVVVQFQFSHYFSHTAVCNDARAVFALDDWSPAVVMVQFGNPNPSVGVVVQKNVKMANLAAVIFPAAPGKPGLNSTAAIVRPSKHHFTLVFPHGQIALAAGFVVIGQGAVKGSGGIVGEMVSVMSLTPRVMMRHYSGKKGFEVYQGEKKPAADDQAQTATTKTPTSSPTDDKASDGKQN